MGFLIAAVILVCCLVALFLVVPVVLGSLLVAVLVAPIYAFARLARRWWGVRRVASLRLTVDLDVGDPMTRQLEEIRRLPEASELPEGRG
jgi:hypothetical protein